MGTKLALIYEKRVWERPVISEKKYEKMTFSGNLAWKKFSKLSDVGNWAVSFLEKTPDALFILTQ